MSSMVESARADMAARSRPDQTVTARASYSAGPLRRRQIEEMVEEARSRGLRPRREIVEAGWLRERGWVEVSGEWARVMFFARLWDEQVG